jgi:hypothetical protein
MTQIKGKIQNAKMSHGEEDGPEPAQKGPGPVSPFFWSHRPVTTHSYSCWLALGNFEKNKLKTLRQSGMHL